MRPGSVAPDCTLFARFAMTNLARIGGSGAFEPEDVSLLHTLFTQKQSPQNEEPETYLFHGGAGQIPELLAGWLRGSMVRIDLNAPVGSIEQDETGVTLRLVEEEIPDGGAPAACYRARYVIVAIPPNQMAKIAYTPQLPAEQLALLQRMPMGKLLKVHAVYNEPFWRTWKEKPEDKPKRLNGIAITDLPTTPFTVDSSAAEWRAGHPDHLHRGGRGGAVRSDPRVPAACGSRGSGPEGPRRSASGRTRPRLARSS